MAARDYDRPVVVDRSRIDRVWKQYISPRAAASTQQSCADSSLSGAASGTAPGRLFRHRVSSQPRRHCRSFRHTRALLSEEGCGATAFTGSPTSMLPDACAKLRRSRKRPRHRRASRQRRLDVRAADGTKHRKHDGIHRARRLADGDAAGTNRSGRGALSVD